MTKYVQKKAEIFMIKSDVIKDLGEVETKDKRPYYFSVEIDERFSAIIPLRSSFKHPYGFVTLKVKLGEEMQNKGLDFTKSLLFVTTDLDSIKSGIAVINHHEYKKINQNQALIKGMYLRYIQSYRYAYLLKRECGLISNKQQLLLQYSTLKNYHALLHINI